MHETVGDRAALKDPASHVLLVFALEGRWMVQYTDRLWFVVLWELVRGNLFDPIGT